MGPEPQPQLDNGAVEFRQGGIHQQGGVRQFRVVGGRALEDGRESRDADEADAIEQVLGVEEAIACRGRIDGVDDELRRHTIPLGQFSETNQQARPHGAEAEEDDPDTLDGLGA